jgi:hypothetical protein
MSVAITTMQLRQRLVRAHVGLFFLVALLCFAQQTALLHSFEHIDADSSQEVDCPACIACDTLSNAISVIDTGVLTTITLTFATPRLVALRVPHSPAPAAHARSPPRCKV